MNMEFSRKLPIPKEIKEQYPVTPEMTRIKEERDAEIAAIFRGELRKLILVIGPCSADSEDSVLDYISRLRERLETDDREGLREMMRASTARRALFDKKTN